MLLLRTRGRNTCSIGAANVAEVAIEGHQDHGAAFGEQAPWQRSGVRRPTCCWGTKRVMFLT
jgi:hypothetical protein